jgi:secernin
MQCHPSRSYGELKGCDTFIAFPPTTPNGIVVFGKNSDRPQGEGQSITKYPARQWYDSNKMAADNNDSSSSSSIVLLRCTYIDIPQAESTYAVLLSQIDWMWGAEMGANECGVVIGNEAVWTNIPEEEEEDDDHHDEKKLRSLLLGMDLVRLGLERGSTAAQAKNVIIVLLEQHGQGGPCAENDPSFTYHNSFLIADYHEAWVLETAGRHWVAQRTTTGGRNISNGLTIRTEFDECSKGLQDYCKQLGLWNGVNTFDFAAVLSSGGPDEDRFSRQGCGKIMLERYDQKGSFDDKAMVEILRDHKSGICMHGGFETTSSMVSVLESRGLAKHWMTGKSCPCESEFLLQEFDK